MNAGTGSGATTTATSASIAGNNGSPTSKGFKRVGSVNSVRYSHLGDHSRSDEEALPAAGSMTNDCEPTTKEDHIANSGVTMDSPLPELVTSESQAQERRRQQHQHGNEIGKKPMDQKPNQDNQEMIKGYSWATPYDFQTPPKPTFLQYFKWMTMYCISFCFTVFFLVLIVIPALSYELGRSLQRMWYRLTHCSTPYATRLFYAEEFERRARRRVAAKEWVKDGKRRQWEKHTTAGGRDSTNVPVDPENGIISPPQVATSARAESQRHSGNNALRNLNPAAATDVETERANEVTIQVDGEDGNRQITALGFTPTAGGPDPLNNDIGHYARRVGLDAEEYAVLTKDGYILELFHIYNPREYTPRRASDRQINPVYPSRNGGDKYQKRKYPILMLSGLLQHVGSYCANDDASLSFYFAKAGYDVWLGGNRCGFNPRHIHLSRHDPKFWKWNVRHMGIFDLPAHLSRVRYETGFEKVALVAHSQGSTQTLYALSHPKLAPGIASQISVASLLAPAAYSGPTLDAVPFRFVRSLPRSAYGVFFGQQSFIPAMVHAQDILPKRFVAYMGYAVFNYLFHWTDARWERDLRSRMFGFAPVFVSAEHMWWWLAKNGFAGRGCMMWEGDEDPVIRLEEVGARKLELPSAEGIRERNARTAVITDTDAPGGTKVKKNEMTPHTPLIPATLPSNAYRPPSVADNNTHDDAPWFSTPTPPLALFIPAQDKLVDGPRLLKRLTSGKQPYTSPTPSVHPSSSRELEPHATICHVSILDNYEHLDPLWAIDAVDRVGTKIRDVIWSEVRKEQRMEGHDPSLDRLVVPKGLE